MNPNNFNNSGLNSGRNSGLNSGMNSGLNSGMNSGLNSGMNSGLNSGLNSGMNSGFNNSGMNSGLNSGLNTFNASQSTTAPSLSRVVLPTQVVEKPMAVHEEIRREQVEEIQPVVNIEKYQTEIHQVTQPLFDKEIRPVNVQRATLAAQTLPEVNLPGRGGPAASDVSTLHIQDKAAMVVEKPAIVTEVDKLQVIQEIQPVLYKETVVPTVIQETKPVYQRIVEGPVYVQETLPARELHGSGFRSVPTQQPIQSIPVQQPVQYIPAQQPHLIKKPDLLVQTTKTTTTTTTNSAPNLPTYAS